MSDPTPRQQIEAWLAEWPGEQLYDGPEERWWADMVRVVRAALEIIDESHAPRVCGPGPCQFQVEHERKLLEAINGR